MALPSNAESDLTGEPSPFFSPFPLYSCAGVNVFAQSPMDSPLRFTNPYVFPPFPLVGQVLHFLRSVPHLVFTLVMFDFHPRKYWWPIPCSISSDSRLLSPKGSPYVVLQPSTSGYASIPSPGDLWAFRIRT